MQACCKIILFGEHAAVYGHPAIALPISSIFTEANIKKSDMLKIHSNASLNDDEKAKLEKMVRLVIEHLKVDSKISIHIESNIPIGSGMGSSASLSIALIRTISEYFSLGLQTKEVCNLAFECEKIFHGNPSGIDNSVIAYEKPVYFIKDRELTILNLKKGFRLLIAGTGIKSHTHEIVSEVKNNYIQKPEQYDRYFKEIGKISNEGRKALEEGDIEKIGFLMNRNHELLQKIGVSNGILDSLVEASLDYGALGSKLVGAGKGGNMIALIKSGQEGLKEVLLKKGAVNVIEAVING